MPRGRKPGNKKTEVQQNTLLEALRFISVAQRKIGSIEQVHCRLSQMWSWASNGIITAAAPIQEPLDSCPNTFALVDALEQAPGAISLTQLEPTKLSVRSQDFQAVIPCVEASALPIVGPDAAVALCDDRLKRAMQIAGLLATDGADMLLHASIQLRPGSALASNGILIIEAWHGLDLPPLLYVPKALVTALTKAGQPIVKVGASESSITLWYENGAWIKCQTYPLPGPGEVPDFLGFLNISTTPVPVPAALFSVAKRLEPFSGDGMIYFSPEGAKVTSPEGGVYANNEITGVPPGVAFNIKSLLTIANYCKTIHFLAADKITLWYGDGVRGAIVTDVQT